MKTETICAISTPIGIGSVSIVKMSGDKSLEIASKIFSSKNIDINYVEPRKAILGNFKYKEIVDKCILLYFKSPFSFTGEDVVEFQCHGGVFITQKILEACLDNGAILATKGEFSKRAFLNGKISLDEAEGIIDTINAESESELLVSQRLQKGNLRKQVELVQDNLTSLLAKIDLSLDYPEHDDEVRVANECKKVVDETKNKIDSLLKTVFSGQIIRNGIQVAIIGKPNVGKSSVLNALIGSERAIVSDIAGTTRDIVSESILYNGIKIKFADTAGIRTSNDTIERIGIERAKEEAQNSDVVLAIFDGSKSLDDYDKEILAIAEHKKSIIVVNKNDEEQKFEIPSAIVVSVKTGKNLELIKEKIVSFVTESKLDLSGEVVVNSRQTTILENCKQIVSEIEDALEGQTLDIVAFLIKNLWNEIGKITGRTENEEIIDELFSKFCLGK
ncbi:MAG: tRNA uridine-5-carboxymethylaminomethyl(34) synthesis GTPase MnmE [Clostridia bacterium]